MRFKLILYDVKATYKYAWKSSFTASFFAQVFYLDFHKIMEFTTKLHKMTDSILFLQGYMCNFDTIIWNMKVQIHSLKVLNGTTGEDYSLYLYTKL